MNFYEKNIAFFEKKDRQLVEALKQYEPEQTDVKVYAEEGRFGYPVIICEKEGKSFYLSSPFDGEGTYEEAWMKQFAEMDYEGMLYCFGFARVSYLKKIREERKGFIQFIYEPSVAVFQLLLEWVDLTFLEQQDILVVKGLNDEDWAVSANALAHKEVFWNGSYLCVPNYEKFCGQAYQEYTKTIKKINQNRCMDEGVWLRFSNEIARNLRDNVKDILRSGDLIAVKDAFPKGKPGILVSAGPSLNNNIEELKKAQGKALIAATDTALKPLLNHGIRPDVFVTVDPSKPLLLFDQDDVWKIPMIITENGNAQVLEKHQGRAFFTLMLGGFCVHIFEKFGKELPFLETGGSVANNAFSFLRECGCNPIILVGQDLAYTNKKSHADGTFRDKMLDINTKEDQYIEIEDIYGNTTYTTSDFKHYLEWFEDHIQYYPETKVIDATEGGAKIHGAELMTLREAIGKYCLESFDAGSYFENAPDVFKEEEREEVEEYLLSTPEVLEKIRKKAKQGKQSYEEMIFRIRRNEWGKELKSNLKKVGKLTDFLDEEETMIFISPFMAEWDHQYKMKLRKMDVNTTEGLLEMLESGKEYMEKIEETIDSLKDDFMAMTEKVKELRNKDCRTEK